jgi:hypothetical protein
LSLCLIKHHAMRKCGSGGIAPPFLTSALGGGEWSASRPGPAPRGKSPRYPFDRRLVGPTAGLSAVQKRKISYPAGKQTLAVQPVAIPTELS